jgi:hypothetical protein
MKHHETSGSSWKIHDYLWIFSETLSHPRGHPHWADFLAPSQEVLVAEVTPASMASSQRS